MKRKWVIVVCVLLCAALLFPIPIRMKDGGTVEYKAMLYSISDVHRINPDIEAAKPFLEGTIIKILGIEVFNNVH